MAKGDFAKESFKGLPDWAKGVIAIAVVGGIAFIAYKLYKKGKDIKEGKGNRQEEKGWNKELDELSSNPATKPTLSQAQMAAFANSLFIAMDGYATDEQGIISIFKNVRNNADFAGINAAYGIREISSGRFNPEPNYKGNLIGGLASELSQYWRDEINKDLASKKITYRV